MANENFSRQQNSLPDDDSSNRIIQEDGFSGTVIDALQDVSASGPDAQDLVWIRRSPVSHDVVDGPHVQQLTQGNNNPVARPRQSHASVNHDTSYSNPQVTSPMQRHFNLPSEQSIQEVEPIVYITIRRRQVPLEGAQRFTDLSEEEKEAEIRERRAVLVEQYLAVTQSDFSLQNLMDLCKLLVNTDVDIERKYIELDIRRVFEANKEKSQFLLLPQGLGILEKYAGNLIKESRPPYWRTVKFTSSLVQAHVGRLIGSRDILSQMGYTQDIADGVAFPGNVPEPNVTKLKDLAPDLFFARYEIDTLLVNEHPFYEMDPPVPREEVDLPRLFRPNYTPSRPQPFPHRASRPPHPVAATTTGPGDGMFSPRPSPRRQGGKEPIDPSGGQGKGKIVLQVVEEPQQAEQNNDSEGDSEYEDAEEGILPANDSSPAQASTDFECRVCGGSVATKFCKECKDTFCPPCDGLYHKHAARQHHIRTELVTSPVSPPRQPQVASAAPSSATAAPATVTTQQSHGAAATSAAGSAGNETRQRQRPVPAPRRNIKQPPSANQGLAQGARTPESKGEHHPPPIPPKPSHEKPQRQQTRPTSPPVQHSTSPRLPVMSPVPDASPAASMVQNQRAAQQPVVTTAASQRQSQRREILRPPPFPNFNTATQQSSVGPKDENDGNVPVQDVPPPLPPRQSTPLQPKMPVESKTPASPDEGGALSCPNCYCLNSAGVKTCMFCLKPLPLKPPKDPEMPFVSQGSRNIVSGTKPTTSSSNADQVLVDPDKWQCKHCTFINSRVRKICEMCCRTSNIPPPPSRTAEPTRSNPGSQPATQRENQAEQFAPQNCTNMVMQITSQQTSSTNEQSRKPEPTNQQATQKEMSARLQTERPLGNTFPVGGELPARLPWDGSGRAEPTVPVGPHLERTYPGAISPSPGRLLNQSEMVSPGGMLSLPTRNAVHGDGVPFGQYGFPPPPPPPHMMDPMGMPAPFSEVNPAASISSPIGDPLHHHLTTGLPQTSPPPAWTAPTTNTATVRRHQEEIYIAGARYVEWLKKAEKEGFTAEELNIATVLGCEDREGPIHWLETAWYDLIHRVMVELSIPENSQEIGNISPEEVREALIDCTGEVSRAVNKCMENRKKKVKELQQAGVYAKTDCITALDNSEGDAEKAILTLEKMAMRPMLQRILNSCLPDSATQDEIVMALTRQTNNETDQEKANFEAIVRDAGQDMDRRIRAVLAEKNVPSWGRAEVVIKLIDMGYGVDDSVEAARNCGDLTRSLRYLRQECPLCAYEHPMSQMITFLHCQDRVCQDCVSQYITITIKDKNIMKLVCPVCGKPENLDDEVVATEYFNNFDILIRGIVDRETHDLFQRKLRDRTLMKEPNFRWCSHCSSGFINERPGQIKMMCPHCQQFTCFKCKRQWEDQHEGITCEQFAAWKEANDPEFQAAGLAAHLRMNGIECPNCKYRYDLSKGGCMHFKCAMCPHEFCSGCYNPFVNTDAQNCRVSEQCTVRGLHAHHPRDCYFYLRDQDPENLQKLLRDNNVPYNTEPPEAQAGGVEDPAGAAAAAPLHCKVNEQKETVDGLVDAECGEAVQAGNAGLCRKHYIEYLVVLVNNNLLDPADIMLTEDLGHVLRRGYVQQPPKPHRMNADQYHELLLQTVKEQLPLPPKPPRKRILDDDEEVALRQHFEEIEEDVDDDDDDNDDVWQVRQGNEHNVLGDADDELEPGSIG